MKKNTFLLFIFLITLNSFSQNPVSFYPTSQASGLNFGSKIASHDNNFLVSSNSFSPQFGRVYLFNLTSSSITQTDSFYPTDALISDSFGKSISLNNEFIAIGSPYHDANFENSGAVYVYRKVVGTWVLLQKIMASDATTNDQFGTFVKIHNNQLFISSINYQNGNFDLNSNNGTVYVYSFNGSQWVFSQILTTAETFKFGEKIEFENNQLIVLGRENTNEFSAKFHTYNFDGTNWNFENSTEAIGSLEEKITDFSLSENQLFIISTSLNANSVSIYDFNNSNWVFSNALNLTTFPDQIFTRLKVNNNNLFIGSTEYILQIQRKFPLLYYKKINDQWLYQSAFYGTDISGQDDYFGAEIELSGNNLIIGAPSEGIINSGKAYYLDLLLSNEEFKKEKTIAYPNPTKDFIYIQNNNLQNINSVGVYSITGKLLISKKDEVEKLSLQDLSSGIYFLKINFKDNLNQTLKIIKE